MRTATSLVVKTLFVVRDSKKEAMIVAPTSNHDHKEDGDYSSSSSQASI